MLKNLALTIARKAYNYAFSIGDPQLNQKLSDVGWQFGGSSSVAGKNITDTTSMNVTAFFAGVRLLSETMGGLPRGVFARDGKDGQNSVPAFDHRLHEVLVHQPNELMNGIEYCEASTANLAARGNCYSIIERGGDGNVSSLWNLEASKTKFKRDKSTDWEVRYGYSDRGKMDWYPADKIWHRRIFSFTGILGLAPIECAKEALGLALAGEEFNSRLFAQGLSPSARISIPEWLSPDQRKLAEKKINEMHAGLANMNKPMLLEGGMKVESGLITPEEAQFLSLRQMTVVEICRILGIKPHMVAALERATDNNIEKLSLEFVTYTMLPYIRRDEAAVRKLFRPQDRAKFFFRYNFEGLLRADSAARAQLYSILLQNGVFSRNEVRALENRNQATDEEMDKFTVQSNMALIDQLAQLVAAREGVGKGRRGASGDAEADGKATPLEILQKAMLEQRSSAPVIHVHPTIGKQNDTHINVEAPVVNITPPAIHVDQRSYPNQLTDTVHTENQPVDFEPVVEATERLLTEGKEGNQELMQAMERVATLLKSPIEPVYDAEGKLIGARRVEELKE